MVALCCVIVLQRIGSSNNWTGLVWISKCSLRYFSFDDILLESLVKNSLIGVDKSDTTALSWLSLTLPGVRLSCDLIMNHTPSLNMWQEARKQERKIRGIIVDYKRRAERRRDFYEKIKADPTQFLQLHGRPVKIHLDPAVALAGDSPANMMPWQGDPDILIDRFDVRAHLDYIPDHPQKTELPEADDLSREDRLSNYERYRIIVQNEFLGVGEEKFLHQLYLEEQFEPVVRPPEVEKKKRGEKAAIPYIYEEGGAQEHAEEGAGDKDKDEEEDEDSDMDFDLCVDVTQVESSQAHEMNVCGSAYGMQGDDFFTFMTLEIDEKESLRLAREQEEEKAMYSGRKSRRERRAFREKRLLGRKISPPSYAARRSPTYDAYRKSVSKSRSRSHSPVNAGQITYITSFGGEEEDRGGTSSSGSRSRPAPPRSSVPVTSRSTGQRSRSPGDRSGYRYRYRAHDNSSSPPCRYGPHGRPGDFPIRSRHDSRSRDRTSNSTPVHAKSSHFNDYRNRSRRRHSSSGSDLSLRSHSPTRSKSPANRPPPPPLPPPPPPISNSNIGFGTITGTKVQQKLTPQERLKRKMQVLLNRQFKADKRAERMRYEKQEQERQDREDELREMAIKLRRRERERRHRMQEDEDGEEEDAANSRSHSRTSQSVSRSPSPSSLDAQQGPSSRKRNRWDQASEPDEHGDHVINRERSRSQTRSRSRSRSRSRTRSRSWSPSKPKQRSLVDY